jgi:hypothetical protein
MFVIGGVYKPIDWVPLIIFCVECSCNNYTTVTFTYVSHPRVAQPQRFQHV